MFREFLFPLSLAFCFFSCNANDAGSGTHDNTDETALQEAKGLQKAYFASGCFWCVEHIYENVKGVQEVISGYAGGDEENPTYQEVGSGQTGHAEAVMVSYDPEVVDFKTLVKVFYASQDPTTVGQDPDFGSQYRSIIFYNNEREKRIAQAVKDSVDSSGKHQGAVVTEIEPLEQFYEAEDYHQDYVEKHPGNGYVRQVSNPRFEDFKEKMPEVLK